MLFTSKQSLVTPHTLRVKEDSDANRKSQNNSKLTISDAIVAAPVRWMKVDGVSEHFSEQQTKVGVGIVEEG
jgi:hypothetical protein